MHDEPTCDRSAVVSEAQRENDVLRLLLSAYPAVFSLDEMVAELTGPDSGFAERDGVSCAIEHLACSRLLHQHGSFVWAARTAKAAFVLDEG